MPASNDITSYPPAMLTAISRARELGRVSIPSSTPNALRLKFYGLKTALKRENRIDEIATLSFIVKPNELIILDEAANPIYQDLNAALDALPVSPTNPIDEANAALDRILNGS